MIERDKIKCTECKWIGKWDDVLQATNPFDSDDIIFGCPSCKSVDQFRYVCDEPGCKEEVSCGTATDEGYRRTCGKHCPEREPRE